jgi:ELWxxDGT repeat protein
VTAFTGEVWSTDGTEEGTIRLAEAPFAGVVANSGKAIYFTNFDIPSLSDRLWVTDGSVAGTRSLLDDLPHQILSTRFAAVPATRRVYFAFNDRIHGRELWTSDGTVASTRQVLDLRPGSEDGLGGFGNQLTVFQGKAYFSADDGSGPALWTSDGTAAGTARIFSFGAPGEEGAFGPFTFTPLAGRLLFFAQTPASGIEPWATDGTAAGTVQLAEIGAGAHSITNLSDVHSTGSLVYFAAASDDPEGVELWRSDGTSGGTFPITDFPGAEPFGQFSQLSIATVGQSVAFAADDGVHGFEPWGSDGTVAGTRLIKDVCPGSCDGSRGGFVGQGSTLYFVATSQSLSGLDLEPWVSNLTAAGTRRLKDLCVGLCSSGPDGFVSAGGFVYLTAADRNLARHLWRTNGTTSGTVRVADGTPEPPGAPQQSLVAVAFGNTLLFSWSDPQHGWEPWRSDGSRAGTRRIADLEHLDQGGSIPFRFMKAGTKSFFFANDGIHGREPWTSDGTAGGTRLVRELEPGPGPAFVTFSAPWAEANGRLVFVRSFFSGDPELWGSDGTATGTVRLLDPGTVVDPFLRAVGSKVYFLARDAAHGAEPWVTDGTTRGTRLLRDTTPGPEPIARRGDLSLFALQGRLLFRGGGDPLDPDFWLSNGTPASTVPLANVYPFLVEPLAGLSGDPVELGGKIYFDRSPNGLDSTLWVTDLTAAGTRSLGPVSGEPGFRTSRLFVAGQKIFVSGRSDRGNGLWATDGRPGGARLLGRFSLEFSTNIAPVPTAFSGKLFFRTSGTGPNPDLSGAELWVSNGTVAGTRRVQDPSGAPILDPRALVVFAHQLICSAAQSGFWGTNGTPAGTAQLFARSPVVDPQSLVVAGSRLYFANMDAETGTELWALRP